MGNSLGLDLRGKCVLLKKSVMSATYQSEAARTVNVTGGNGAMGTTMGHALYVQFTVDGTTACFYGEDVERLIGDAKPIVIRSLEIGDEVDWREPTGITRAVVHLGCKVVRFGRKYVYVKVNGRERKVLLSAIESTTRFAKYA